jgi:SprT protein
MATANELVARAREVLEEAARRYGRPDLLRTEVRLNLRGKAAGKAWLDGSAVAFNLKALEKAPEHVMTQTVPHEVAHLVAAKLGDTGHGEVWKRVARELGCRGDRCHSIGLPSARRVRKWFYQAADGSEIGLSRKHHELVFANPVASITFRNRKTGSVATISRENYVGTMLVQRDRA